MKHLLFLALLLTFIQGNGQKFDGYLVFTSAGVLKSKMPQEMYLSPNKKLIPFFPRIRGVIKGFKIVIPLREYEDEVVKITKNYDKIKQIFRNPLSVDYQFLQTIFYQNIFDQVRSDYNSNGTAYVPAPMVRFSEIRGDITNTHINPDERSEFFIKLKTKTDDEPTIIHPIITFNSVEKNFIYTFEIPKKIQTKNSASLEYSIIRISFLKKMCIDWFNSLKNPENKDGAINIDVVNGALSLLSKNKDKLTDIEALQKKINLESEINYLAPLNKDKDELLKRIEAFKEYNITTPTESSLTNEPFNVTQIRSVSKWIASWLWLSGLDIKLNPFKFTSPDNLSDQDTATIAKTVLYYTRDADSSLTKASAKNLTREFDNFTKITTGLDASKKNLKELTKINSDNAQNKNSYNSFQKDSIMLYTGYLFFNNTKNAKGYKEELRNYYDSSTTFSPVAEKKPFKYPGTTHVLIAYHNLPVGSKIKITGSFTSTTEKTVADNFFGAYFDSVSIPSGLSTIATSPLLFASLPLAANVVSAMIPLRFDANLNLIPPPAGPRPLSDVDYQNYYRYYKILYASSMEYPIVDSLKEVADSVPNYMTQIYRVNPSMELPAKFNYNVSKIRQQDTVKVDSSIFKIYPQHIFTVAIGVEYSPSPVNHISVDTSLPGQIKPYNNIQYFHLIVSLKIHPFNHGLYLEDESFNGRALLRKTNFIIGVGFPSPQDNYYLGAGIDIVPGFSVHGGFHFNRLNKYYVQDNELLQQGSYIRTNGFISLSVDPALFTTIVKAL